jgi:hypothetical protein
MKGEARYNKKQSKYPHNIHHGELLPNASVENNAPTAAGQNLDADKGISGARKSLLSLFTKK